MENILFARLPENIVVIRVVGRGNHQSSLALRHVLEETSTDDDCPEYVFDLEKCPTMDSTFMGVMASIGLRQQRIRGTRAMAVNLTARVQELLEVLGLKFILKLRLREKDKAGPTGGSEGRFAPVATPQVDKVERIVMMIEAHEQLIDIGGENEVKFRGVLQSLRDSLKRAKAE